MESILLFLSLGGQEILFILLIILLLFGARKIPELARGLGKGIREFKDATSEVKQTLENEAGELDVQEKPKAIKKAKKA